MRLDPHNEKEQALAKAINSAALIIMLILGIALTSLKQ